jgi:hypothetical protein
VAVQAVVVAVQEIPQILRVPLELQVKETLVVMVLMALHHISQVAVVAQVR